MKNIFNYSKDKLVTNFMSFEKIIIALLIMFPFSCTDTEVSPLSETSNKNGDVYLQSDYLVFKEYELFKKALLYNDDYIVNEKYEEWENMEGFQSLNNIYLKAVDKQSEYLGDGWCPFIKDNESSFSFNDDGSFDANMIQSPIRSIINKDGIVKVGVVMYQFTRENIKVFVGNDTKKLISAKVDDPKNKLYIRNINGASQINSEMYARTNYNYYNHNLYGEAGDSRNNLENRSLLGRVRQSTMFVPGYNPEDDTFGDDLPVTSLYVRVDYLKGKNDKVIDETTKVLVGAAIKVVLKLLIKNTSPAFIFDIFAAQYTNYEVVNTPARLIGFNYDVRIHNGYNTIYRQGDVRRNDSGGFGFYFNIPNNNTSQPEAFYLDQGEFNFYSDNTTAPHGNLSCRLEYPRGDIQYAGYPTP